MAAKRTGSKRRPARASKPHATDRGATLAIATLCVVLAGTALAVDTQAANAFDAPKRAIALLGAAAAAALAFGWPLRKRAEARENDGAPEPPWAAHPPARRAAFLLAAAALAWALVAALVSPRREISLDAMRSVALLALLLPLGASRVLPRGRAWLLGTFLTACTVNAVVAVLESRGAFRPFALQTFGNRQDTGAYAGNVGYLAITLALGSVAALGIALTAATRARRIGACVLLAVFGGGLVVNQNLTALTALLAGAVVLLLLRFRARAALPMAAAVVAVGLAVAAFPPLRHRAGELTRAARAGDWDALLSFRGGPWAASLEMVRERPLTGFGPGTFAAEYVPHRVSAEVRHRRRFVVPLLTSSYAEAHNDYLQVFADTGIPGGLLAVGAAACLLAAAGRAAWRGSGAEALVLAGLLTTGAAAALTWFPFQRPITAVPLLLAAGRAWRVSGQAPSEPEAP